MIRRSAKWGAGCRGFGVGRAPLGLGAFAGLNISSWVMACSGLGRLGLELGLELGRGQTKGLMLGYLPRLGR